MKLTRIIDKTRAPAPKTRGKEEEEVKGYDHSGAYGSLPDEPLHQVATS